MPATLDFISASVELNVVVGLAPEFLVSRAREFRAAAQFVPHGHETFISLSGNWPVHEGCLWLSFVDVLTLRCRVASCRNSFLLNTRYQDSWRGGV